MKTQTIGRLFCPRWYAVCLMVMLCVSMALADSFHWDLRWDNGYSYTSTTGDDKAINFSTDKNSSSTDPQVVEVNTSDNELRLYYHSDGSGGSITITPVSGWKITKVVMTTSSNPTTKYKIGSGSLTTLSYSGSGTYTATINSLSVTSSLTIQNCNTTNTALKIKSIIVTYESNTSGNCDYYIYNGSSYELWKTLPKADLVPTEVPDNSGAGYYFRGWSEEKYSACSYPSSLNDANKLHFYPNSPESPDHVTATAYTATTLYAIYQNGGCWKTDIGVPNCTVLSAPTNLSSSVSGTSVTLSWDAVMGAASYEILIYDSKNATYKSENVGNVTSKTYTISDSDTYKWWVYAVSGIDTSCDSNWSDEDNFEVVGCKDISSVKVTVHDITPVYNCTTNKWEIDASWNRVDGANVYQVALQYYGDDNIWHRLDSKSYNTPDLSMKFPQGETDIVAGKKYQVRVFAGNTICSSVSTTEKAYSNEVTVACPPVTNLEVVDDAITKTGATLIWSADGKTGCDLTYDITVKKHSDNSVVWSQSNSSNDTHVLTGLESSTQYDVYMTAYNACGNSNNNDDDVVHSFTTQKGYVNYVYTCIDVDLKQTDNETTKPVLVTSAAGQSVKAVRTLDLTILGAAKDAVVTLAGNDLEFYLTDGTKITSTNLKTDATTGNLEQTLYVAYAPTTYAGESFAQPTITVSCDGNNVQFEGLVKARCLPDQFVIAAKVGSGWLALSNQVKRMSTQDGMPIVVNDNNNPTAASVALNTSEYSLNGLPSDKPNQTDPRLKVNGTAAYLIPLYTGNTDRAIRASVSSTAIGATANMDNAARSDSALFYEWKLVSEDLVTYNITNSNTSYANKILSYSTANGKWGMYSGAIQDVRLLPITNVLNDIEVEVMEWATDKMALRFIDESNIPAAVKITLGGTTTASLSLTEIGAGSDLRAVTVSGISLTSNDCEVMMLTDANNTTSGTLIRKPIIISGEVQSSSYSDKVDICASCDAVVVSGGRLVADQASSVSAANRVDFQNLYIYPGGKFNMESKKMGVKQKVYIRGGYSFLNPDTYALPELYVTGGDNFTGSGDAIYDYYIKNYTYYQFSLPKTVPLAKVTDEAGYDFPVWVKHYNGALRAADAHATSWEWYNGDNFERGMGYVIAAKPRQMGKVANRPLSIIRFPLGSGTISSTENQDVEISTTAHGIAGYNAEPRTVTANNVGWNFVGNPYMATWKGDIGHKQLVKEGEEEHWTGAYKWVETATRYITVMSAESGSDYDQYIAADTDLKPFFPFYMQETAMGGTGSISFTKDNRQKKIKGIMATDSQREALVQIDIIGNGNTDQTGVYVSDKYSDDLDFDDMEKMFGSTTNKAKVWLMHNDTRMAFEAMTEQRAAGNLMLGFRAPETDEYTFTINENSKLSEVEAVLISDNVEGVSNFNLLLNDYIFTANATNFNDTRFTVSVKMKEKQSDISTNLENGFGELQDINIVNTMGGFVLQGIPQNADVWVYDMTGKLIVEKGGYSGNSGFSGHSGLSGNSGNSGETSTLRLSVPAGVYNIRVQSGNEGRTMRAIVK